MIRAVRIASASAALASACLLPAAAGHAAPAEADSGPCPRTVEEATWPVATVDNAPHGEPAPPASANGPKGTAIGSKAIPSPVTHPGPDTDGDGAADDIAFVDDDLVIARGSGTVTITDVPSASAWGDVTARTADLDGDGNDDLWSNFTVVNGNPKLNGGTFLISSATPDGTHAFAAVAKAQPNAVVAGDLTGDGLNDLATTGPAATSNSLNGTRWASLVGFADLAPGDLIVSRANDIVGGWADLDGDGLVDPVFLRDEASGDGKATVHLSRTAQVLPLGDRAVAATTLLRSYEGRPYVWFHYAYGYFTPPPEWRNASYLIQLHCARPWTETVTQTLLDRAAGSAEAAIVAPESDPERDLRTWLVAVELRGLEGRTKLVRDRYEWVLGRNGDSGGVAFWAKALRDGRRTPEQLTASLLASNEFFRNAGATTAAWVEAMYENQLGRGADPSGKAYWIGKVTAVGHERAARLFLSSTGTRRVRAAAIYQAMLGRQASTRELDKGITTIGNGGEDALVVQLGSSDEAYLGAQS